MGNKAAKVLARLRCSPNNCGFEELCYLVEHAGFVRRQGASSHIIFKHASRSDVPLLNLQPTTSGKAKPYQVRQVLSILEDFDLVDLDD